MTERCARMVPAAEDLAPDLVPCENEATGGLRMVVKPHLAAEKRWGRRSLLTFLMDLPLCPGCFARMTIFDCTDQTLRATLGRTAQQMNDGIVADWSRTQLEHVPFEDRDYQILRRSQASQPAPAGPQQGAGNESPASRTGITEAHRGGGDHHGQGGQAGVPGTELARVRSGGEGGAAS